MKRVFQPFLILCLLLILISCQQKVDRILVFSKTMENRHASIETGVVALKNIGAKVNFEVVATEDADIFNEKDLRQFSAVVFLNTTGDVLDAVQQSHFERYIQAGGGFVGIHSATDTEYDWPWYNQLVGAYFKGHPAEQEAQLKTIDKRHPASEHLPDQWTFLEEWYNFKSMNPAVQVLLSLDEDSYTGGSHNGDHPISWYHEYDGGKAFYTGLGHRLETFKNPDFLQHLEGGIAYVKNKKALDYSKAKTIPVPEETRFVKEVLDFNLNEPMELDKLPGRGMIFVERRGAIKLFDFAENKTKQIAQLDLFYGNEDGLLGIAVDPDYENNNWIYLFYSAPGEEPLQQVSRFDLIGDSLHLASEKILLKIPTIRQCCHSGGGLEFGPDGHLFVGLGDNTNPFESNGYAPIDERPGRALWDAQKSAANTNDLRGKILRIKPEADGTYSIPDGNLFPPGTPNTRPEIYAMGLRNPFRFSIDSKTGFLYWGDVGPDAGKTDPNRGPKGMGEFNQARKPGFWGWPYTRGNNQAYNDYDFSKKEIGAKFNPQKVINNSPNNTGLQELPAIQSSLIWYSYDASEEFPWLGEGGVNPMGGPIFHASDYPQATSTFPAYFEDKLFVYEWMRDWVYLVTLDENQQYVKADPFMPSTEFSHPMDMLFGADGQLYVLEYGQKWNVQNLDARLSRISFVAGNREPIAKIQGDQLVGGAPLTINFSGASSIDYDKDELSYEWSFDDAVVQSQEKEPVYTFNEVGLYPVRLKVTDKKGATSVAYQQVMVGNHPPELSIKTDAEDQLFGTLETLNYQVVLEDKEDGSVEEKTIDPSKVKVTFNYIPEGEDLVLAAIGHQQNMVPKGRQIIDQSDCKACHGLKEKVNGPSYQDIAKKYTKADKDYLVSTVIKGGSGVWGETLMSAHPQLSVEEVGEAVNYILSLDPDKELVFVSLPLSGTLEFKEHLIGDGLGKYVLMASYLDEGHPDLPGSALSAQEQVVFVAPLLQAENALEKSAELSTWDKNGDQLVGSIVDGSYLKFEEVSMLGLKGLRLNANFNATYNYQGEVEVRKGAINGPIMGQAAIGYFHEDKDAVKYYDISLLANQGKAPLYLVFKNKLDTDQMVLNLDWIRLEYGLPLK